MLARFRRTRKRSPRTVRRRRKNTTSRTDWKTVKLKEFTRRYGRALAARSTCSRCRGPVSEAMHHCPWCGFQRAVFRGTTSFPSRCTRCGRGVKLDWRFCAWCYGAAIGPLSTREYADKRYTARCSNQSCKQELMPFMRYCPWCRAKVSRKWKVTESKQKCSRCGWGVLGDYWSSCPWCGKGLS